MGEKGARLTTDATATAGWLVDELEPVGDVTSKKMFGGYGVFSDGVMFAIVDSAGTVYLRTGDANLADFETAGAHKHGRMPYHQIPSAVLEDPAQLAVWAGTAAAVARAAKK